jgi:ADP-heptose:LPS heptosyltransferase
MTVSISFTSCLLAFLSGARVRIGAGELDGRKNIAAGLLSIPLKLDWTSDPHRHQTLRNLDTARDLVPAPEDLSSRIFLTDDERKMAEMFLKKPAGHPAIVFHPGAGKVKNRWPADRFAKLADRLAQDTGAQIYITEGPMDQAPVRDMVSLMKTPSIVVIRKTIREVAAILARMDLAVTNDTGIMHVAAAVGIPVLSLFGPTDGAQWAPVGSHHRCIQSVSGEIESIQEHEVLNNALEMLGKAKGRSEPRELSSA